jgi:hypothetical protein
LLFGGLQNAGEHGLGASSAKGAIAAPVFARPDQGTDGALTDIVGGIQPGTIKKGEDIGALMEQVLGEPTVGHIATGAGQHLIQLYFQTSGRGPQAMQRDLVVVVAVP